MWLIVSSASFAMWAYVRDFTVLDYLISVNFISVLQFLDQDRIVTASSTGAVTIFRHHQNSQVHNT